jgi:hypothetical protein
MYDSHFEVRVMLYDHIDVGVVWVFGCAEEEDDVVDEGLEAYGAILYRYVYGIAA